MSNGSNPHVLARSYYLKACRILEKRLKDRPDTETAVRLGVLHLQMDEMESAEKAMLSALELDNESAAVHANLAIVYHRKREFKRAITHFETSLRRNPDDFVVRSNLAEACMRDDQRERAEREYLTALRHSPEHIDSLIGLGELYTDMAENEGEDMYQEAIRYFDDALRKADSETRSKRLSKHERAAICYARGFAYVKIYECSKFLKDEKDLNRALTQFKRCILYDPDHRKGRRAIEKLEKRLGWFSPQRFTERIAPFFIFLPAVFVFLMTQIYYWSGKAVPNIEIASYLSLTFGSLIFMIAGLTLPQILKLKFGGFELEKSAIEQITISGVFGIGRGSVQQMKPATAPGKSD